MINNPPPPLSTPDASETDTELPDSSPDQSRQNLSFLSVIIGAILILLILRIGAAWFFSRYWVTTIVETRDEQLPSSQVTAVQIEPTQVLVEAVPTDTPTPLHISTPSPSPTITIDISQLLAQTESTLQQALNLRDRQQIQTVLDSLDQIEALDPAFPSQVAQLRMEGLFALDALDGTTYLNSENSTRWSLKTVDGQTLLYPIDFTLSNESLYLIDSGTLYRGDWPPPIANGELTLTPILARNAQVRGYPVKEIVAVESTQTEDVFVLDKANDLYRYQPISNTWSLEIPAATQYTSPSPLYLNLGSYANRLYILDPARNQIWRHPPGQIGDGFLPGTLPWLINPGEPDINAGIDLAIDGNIYVLQRDGVIVGYNPAEIARFSLVDADNLSRVSGWSDLPTQPVAIFATVEGTVLHVADAGRRRVVIFDRATGNVLRQLIAPDNPDFAALRGVAEKDNHLYMLAGATLYQYDLGAGLTTQPKLAGQLPELVPLSIPDVSPGDLPPHNPRLPYLLAAYNFQMPFKESLLPDRGAIYPGSRRAYRYGVHQGLDLFEDDIGVEVQLGTPVYAVGDGLVIQADVNYQEMTLDEVNGLLADANLRHFTPPETLKKLNGRQIWIDHGGGVVTRYSHLSGIAENIITGQPIKAGQLIGYVGLSGTPDGITGNIQFPHLHFEMRLGPAHEYYLGQWLTIEETRRAFERIFNIPVRPAYLEFR